MISLRKITHVDFLKFILCFFDGLYLFGSVECSPVRVLSRWQELELVPLKPLQALFCLCLLLWL